MNAGSSFRAVSVRTVQLVLHYDGSAFSGWQVQPGRRTVQGEMERVLARLCGGERVVVQGAGRTDAGVHARGQAAGVLVPERWDPTQLRRALNAMLPDDIWVAAAHDMRPAFHARYSATSREYSYSIGTDDGARSPFRNRWEWFVSHPLDRGALDACAQMILGTHRFLAFAVRGTAPASDDHACTITVARWQADGPRLTFHVAANRFLHHMVRFLVGSMVSVASRRLPIDDFAGLLHAPTNDDTPAPAPPHALVLESVAYPPDLYVR